MGSFRRGYGPGSFHQGIIMEVKQPSKDDIERELTEKNRSMPRQEYPKMKYHPEGHPSVPDGQPPRTVASKEEEDKLGDEWQDTPQDAIDLREARSGGSVNTGVKEAPHASGMKKAK
jgi:hypothetical protein